MTMRYELSVDWDNDNTYSNTHADVWPRLVEGTFQCKRGRNFPSQRTGRSIAGTLTATLDNRDGLFDPLNTASALHGLLFGGRRVRWGFADSSNTMVYQWTGWVDAIRNRERDSGLDTVELSALGVLARLDGRTSVDQKTNLTTGAAARLVFDPDGTIGANPANVDGADYRAGRIVGSREMARWWVNDLSRLEALRELEDTEGGFLHEDKDGFVSMDSHERRIDASSRNSRVTLTDLTPLTGEIPALANGLTPDQPLRDLANRVTTRLRVFSVGNQQVLWSTTGVAIASGATVNLVVRYPTDTSPLNHLATAAWTPLAAGTDYTALTNVTVTFSSAGNEALIVITNSGASDVSMDFQVRGQPLIEDDPLILRDEDQDSIDDYGLAEFTTPAIWLSSIAEVADLHEETLRLFAEPAERITARWEAGSALDQAANRDLSERITLKRRNTAYDYFIESIQHQVRADNTHNITWLLSPAGLYGTVIVLDTGPALNAGIISP